ncbi:hypothetical protein D3C73_1588490 [compost metagenome]
MNDAAHLNLVEAAAAAVGRGRLQAQVHGRLPEAVDPVPYHTVGVYAAAARLYI